MRVTMSARVPAGTNTPYHDCTWYPGNADSAIVGTSGIDACRRRLVTPSAQAARAHIRHTARDRRERQVELAADEIDERETDAFIGNMRDADARHAREHRRGEMRRAAEPTRAVVQPALLFFGERDQFRGGFRRHRRMHH
jgi:hypothetical protein